MEELDGGSPCRQPPMDPQFFVLVRGGTQSNLMNHPLSRHFRQAKFSLNLFGFKLILK